MKQVLSSKAYTHQEGKEDYSIPYTSMSLQPWEIIDALQLNFYEGNALKYLLRRKTDQRVKDLRKAIHYIQHLIDLEESYKKQAMIQELCEMAPKCPELP